MKGRTLKKILFNVFALLLGVVHVGSMIAFENAGAINTQLGIKTYEIVSKSGEDDTEYIRYYESVYPSVKALKEAGFLKAREAEAEGAVLLKNNGALPLSPGEVSLFGFTSMNPVYAGTGSGSVSTDEAPTFADALEEAGFTPNRTLAAWYETCGYSRQKTAASVVTGEPSRGARAYIGEPAFETVERGAGTSFGHGEAAVYVIGRVGGEGGDLNSAGQPDGVNGDYLRLNEEEAGTLRALKALKDSGKLSCVILVINSANPLSAALIEDPAYGIDAALWAGSVGQTGLYAIGDILAGKVNPSGRLPDTWWADNLLNPAMANFGAYPYEGFSALSDLTVEFSSYVVYQEGIYLGYRYTETRYEDAVLGRARTGAFDYGKTVAYPFGFGLSYTTFEYADMNVRKNGHGNETAYEVSVKVTNTGKTAGKETVQVYLQKPYTEYDRQNGVEKAAVELAGFAKTGVLQPGASETVTVTVPEYFFASFDTFGKGTYILDEGTYYLAAAANAHDAVNHILASKGRHLSDGMTAEGRADLVKSFPYGFDDTTYAVSLSTGEKIRPLFSGADINTYAGRGDNSVRYVTRDDWEGSLVFFEDRDGDGKNDNYVRLAMTPELLRDEILDGSDIPRDPDDLDFPVYESTETDLKLIDLRVNSEGNVIAYDDPVWDLLLDQLSYVQTAKLCAVGLRMTAAIPEIGKPQTLDHNGPGGVTQKYGNGQNGYAAVLGDPDKDRTGTCFPCNGILAATFNTALLKEVGEIIGEDGMWAGYAGLYGSGVNIHRTPYAGRVFEYYSEDAVLTGLIDAAETLGIQSKGLYVYNKHFVLNEQENNRSGIGTWVPEQALRENYLRAFELPIRMADAKCVMSAFNRLGAEWCGACTALMTDWLRGEAGMTGFAVTDMYNVTYMSKPHMILAGNDIPDHSPGRGAQEITDEVLAKELAPYGPMGSDPSALLAWHMRESAHRVLYTTLHSRAMDGIDADSLVLMLTPWWVTLLNTVRIILAVLAAASGIWLLADIIKNRRRA